MTSPKFWTEATLAGFLYLLASIFFYMRFSGIQCITIDDSWNEYLPYFTVGVIAASYLFGLMAHILIPRVFGRLARWLHIASRERGQDRTTNDARLLQFGSEALQKHVKSQYSTWILFRLLTVGFPLAGLACAYWISGTSQNSHVWSIIISSLVFGALSLCAYMRLHTEYLRIQRSVDDLTERLDTLHSRPQ